MRISLKVEILLGKFIDYLPVKIVIVGGVDLYRIFFALSDSERALKIDDAVDLGRVKVRSAEKRLLFIIDSVADDFESFAHERSEIFG